MSSMHIKIKNDVNIYSYTFANLKYLFFVYINILSVIIYIIFIVLWLYNFYHKLKRIKLSTVSRLFIGNLEIRDHIFNFYIDSIIQNKKLFKFSYTI